MTRQTPCSRWALRDRLLDPRVQRCLHRPSPRELLTLEPSAETLTPQAGGLNPFWRSSVKEAAEPLTPEALEGYLQTLREQLTRPPQEPFLILPASVVRHLRMSLRATTSPRLASRSEIFNLLRSSRLRRWIRR